MATKANAAVELQSSTACRMTNARNCSKLSRSRAVLSMFLVTTTPAMQAATMKRTTADKRKDNGDVRQGATTRAQDRQPRGGMRTAEGAAKHGGRCERGISECRDRTRSGCRECPDGHLQDGVPAEDRFRAIHSSVRILGLFAVCLKHQ